MIYDCSDTAVGLVSNATSSSRFVAQYPIEALINKHWESVRGSNDFHEDGAEEYSVSDQDFGFTPSMVCFVVLFLCLVRLKETSANSLQCFDEC